MIAEIPMRRVVGQRCCCGRCSAPKDAKIPEDEMARRKEVATAASAGVKELFELWGIEVTDL
jgi:hypothetical protein